MDRTTRLKRNIATLSSYLYSYLSLQDSSALALRSCYGEGLTIYYLYMTTYDPFDGERI